MMSEDGRTPEELAEALDDLAGMGDTVANVHADEPGAGSASQPPPPSDTPEADEPEPPEDGLAPTAEGDEPAEPEDAEPDEANGPDEPDEPDGPEQLAQPDELDEPAPAMRTTLKEFGEQFDARVRPLVEPIRRAVDTVAAAADNWPLSTVLPDLRELAHQVQALCDKVSEQQAYVLIFGPLKSGKSTFMNAMCSTYVSEVTSLPAYPCIVNVSHGEMPGFTVTRYDGTTMALADQDVLADVLQGAHRALMDRIRAVEAEGEDFDPARHMPDAVRKIDVRLPTADLAESGAVLVDTPGLYSRMKFGYDRLTRDFRNAAACAIFIVKTDNLFLEQVFDEFQELLDLFSRVFLIVNLDVTKRDLAPDGSLVPSLEREDPQRIITAFRDLSLSAPLTEAVDAGRLRIYPVDLLHSASARISRLQSAEEGRRPRRPRGEPHFDALLADLTDYLNSNEYFREFLLDSLRRTESLLRHLGEVAEHEQVAELHRQADQLREERDEAVARFEAVGRLRTVRWPLQAEDLGHRLATAIRHHADAAGEETGNLLAAEIRNWFDGEDGLQSLTAGALGPLSADARNRCEQFCYDEMSRQTTGDAVGLGLDESIMSDLKTAEIDLDPMARSAMADLPAGEAPAPADPPFGTADLPVRRGFWDWVLLRTKAKVRKRLFGRPDAPSLLILPAVKAKRLGEPAEQVMQSLAQQQLSSLLSEVADHLPGCLVDAYAASITAAVTDLLTRREQEFRDRIAELEAALAEVGLVLHEIHSLAAEVGRTSLSVEVLRERFTPPDEEPADEGADQPPSGAAGPEDHVDEEAPPPPPPALPEQAGTYLSAAPPQDETGDGEETADDEKAVPYTLRPVDGPESGPDAPEV